MKIQNPPLFILSWISTTAFVGAIALYLILKADHRAYLEGLSPEKAEEILLDKGYPMTPFVIVFGTGAVFLGITTTAFWASFCYRRRIGSPPLTDD